MRFSNPFPIPKMMDFQIFLVLDVPKTVEVLRATEKFSQILCACLFSEYFPTVNYFLIHPVYTIVIEFKIQSSRNTLA